MKQGFILAFVALLLTALSCAGRKHTAAVAQFSEITSQNWQLIELDGKAVTGELNRKMPFLKFLTEDTRYVATGGCNTLNGKYVLKGEGEIRFEPGITTLMACEDMETDRALIATFANADRYELSAGVLSFFQGNEALARYKPADDAQALVGTWELDHLAGNQEELDALFPNGKPTLVFDEDTNRVHGKGGCNAFNSIVKLTGKEIGFGPIASTKMACPGNGEHLFFQALEKVNAYSLDDAVLTLTVDDVASMRFKKTK